MWRGFGGAAHQDAVVGRIVDGTALAGVLPNGGTWSNPIAKVLDRPTLLAQDPLAGLSPLAMLPSDAPTQQQERRDAMLPKVELPAPEARQFFQRILECPGAAPRGD